MTETLPPTDDLCARKDRLIEAMLAHVPFDGWSRAALARAAQDIGIPPAGADILFPGSAVDLIAWHSLLADRHMMAALMDQDLDAMRIRDRIATAVMTRLEQNSGAREAVRRGLAILSRPRNSARALQLLYRTVDDMWFAAGDRSTDWNFYSKRGLLSGVYSTTLLVWLDDHSENFTETRAFLDRRIENVMQVPRIKSRLARLAACLPEGLPPRGLPRFSAPGHRMRGAR